MASNVTTQPMTLGEVHLKQSNGTWPLAAPTPPSTLLTFWEGQGGYYGGKIIDPADGKTYALVIAPKASGHTTSKAWATSNQAMGTTGNLYNGWLNTSLNNNPTYPAFQWARSLVINDFNDFYIPSLMEMEILYRNAKPSTQANNESENFASWRSSSYNVPPSIVGNGHNLWSDPVGARYSASVPSQTTNPLFQAGGSECFDNAYYWTSSWFVGSYAWSQIFINGDQGSNNQSGAGYVRAVRRVKLN